LTQNTRWENVEQTLPRLKSRGLVTFEKLLLSPIAELEGAIRPTGFFRQKTKTIKRVARFFNMSAKLDGVPKREDLLALKGIGSETADSILLYGFGRPEFVADAYSRRLLQRLGIAGPGIGYSDAKQLFEACLDQDIESYKILHALIVQHAKQICRKRPMCEGCGLKDECQTYLCSDRQENEILGG
jgi:endonuclease-3 related protein